MAYQNKANLKKGYQPFYNGWIEPRPPRIGFEPKMSIIGKANYDQILESINNAFEVSIDTETSGLEFADVTLRTVNIGLPNNHNYIGFYDRSIFEQRPQEALATDDQLDTLVEKVLHKDRCYFWNREFDQKVLMHTRGFEAKDFYTGYDGLHWYWFLDTNVRTGKTLKNFSKEFLGIIPPGDYTDVIGDDIIGDYGPKMDKLKFIEYCCYDACMTLEAGHLLYSVFKNNAPFLVDFNRDFISVMMDFTESERSFDPKVLLELQKETLKKIEDVRTEFYETYGMINLGSPKQKSDKLFELGWDTGKRSEKTRFNKDGTERMGTGAKDLMKLVKQGCKPAEMMIKYNQLVKLEGTYISPLLNYLRDSGNKGRFYYHLASAPTLRLSCGKYNIDRKPYDYYVPMNFQALPKGHSLNRFVRFNKETLDFEFIDNDEPGAYYVESANPRGNLRCCLIAPSGKKLIKFDYTAIEMYCGAVAFRCDTWLHAFINGYDAHDATARKIFHMDETEQVDSDVRKKAKICNFLLLNGGNEYGIYQNLGLELQEARTFVQQYVAGLPDLYGGKRRQVKLAEALGYVEMQPYGFQRKVKSYFHSSDPGIRAYGERTVYSQLTQGMAALIMRVALVRLWTLCWKEDARYFNRGIDPILTTHDEIVIACPNELVKEFIPQFQKVMVGATPLNWPEGLRLKAEPEIGYNYGEMIELERDADGEWIPAQISRAEKHADPEPEPTLSSIDILDDEESEDSFGGIDY